MWKYTKFFMAVKMLNYRFALIAATALTVLWLLAYQHNHQSSFKGHLPNFPSLTNPLELDRNDSDASGGSCNDFAEQSSVVVTVKTGATEAYSRVFTLMSTIYQCYASNTYIFSDIEQTIGPYRIHNALAAYPDDFKRSNTDFELYFEQQRLKELGVITTSLHDMKNSRQSGDLASWILDKYKNTHIWEMIYSQRPQADWYLHVDADTYVVWSSLEAWLPHLDPSEELFMGSTAYLSNIGFLHGGSGILASRATMENYAVTHQGIASRWNDKIHNECCGDYVLARALDECGIQITNAWPSINGESPSTIPFNDKHWCQPVVTLHHMSSEEVQTFYQFEARRKNPKAPLQYYEIYNDFIAPHIPQNVTEDWDNRCGDAQTEYLSMKAVDIETSSAEECETACKTHDECLQWSFSEWNHKCSLSTNSVILGKKRLRSSNGEKMVSGWYKERIAEWLAKREICGSAEFPLG